MTTLATFLEQRWQEAEADALAALDAPGSEWWVNPRKQRVVWGSPSTRVPIAEALGWTTAKHIARNDPARVLADIASKRAVLAEAMHFDGEDSSGFSGDYARGVKQAFRDVLRHLASVYADHPDYRDEWKP